MAKIKTKKTKISGIVDRTSMGMSMGIEMEITNSSHTKLRKALSKAISNGLSNHNVQFRLTSGSSKTGNATFLMEYMDKKNNNSCNSICYNFKQMGNKHFLNITGNPTTLIAGRNDIPVLIKGDDYGKCNPALSTFKYLNRIMYMCLDTLLEEHGFKWEGVDKQNIVNGVINIQSYQLAWYSGDLKDKRNDLLRYLRVIYGGLDATKDSVRTAVSAIGLNARIWDNHEGNLTIEAKKGDKNRSFTLTFYAKDEEPEYGGNQNEKDRLSSLIRWDCTLNYGFLDSNNISKIHQLEMLYTKQCEANGYDIGFVKYIAEAVQDKLKLNYFVNLNLDKYKQSIEEGDRLSRTSEKIVWDYWKEYCEEKTILTNTQLIAKLNIKSSSFYNAKNRILELGIDIDVPRSTHDSVLLNREIATLTRAERGINLLNERGEKSNIAISRREMIDRDKERSKSMSNLLTSDDLQSTIRIRRLTPIKTTPSKFWIFTSPPLRA